MNRRSGSLLCLLALLGAARAQPEVQLDRFAYPVNGLQIRAVVCRPPQSAGLPLLNLVHGGLDAPVDEAACRRFARLGYLVAASALRGQGGSAGRAEVCAGEVDDVLALRQLAQRRYHTDPKRVAYLGVSLGGCVALKAAARDRADPRAVITLLSPSDFAEQLRVLALTRPGAVARWEGLLGGSPAQVPAAYAARRPLQAAGRLKAPLLTVAAGNDPLIPLRQSCAVLDRRRQAGKKPVLVRQTPAGAPAASPDQPWRRCAGERPRGSLPPLRGRDVLLIYSGLGHASTPTMWRVVERYLAANIEPPKAGAR